MTKLFTIAVALATLAFGGVALAGGGGGGGKGKGGTAKFDSTVTMKFSLGNDPYDPYYEEAVFKGKVKAKPANKAAKKSDFKKKCTKGRTVVIKRGSTKFDQTKTDEKGKYSVPAADAYTEPGTYRAKVLKKKKNKIDLKCEAAKSSTVPVP
jgi:hypothetical protein